MSPQIAAIALLVPDYDEAIDFFVRALGFELLEDTALANGKRWVRVAPHGRRGAALLLAKATSPDQASAVGRQSGGRVFLFLSTEDFEKDHARLVAAGVPFEEAPRLERYGKVAVFRDVFGNRWDLVQWFEAQAHS